MNINKIEKKKKKDPGSLAMNFIKSQAMFHSNSFSLSFFGGEFFFPLFVISPPP